MHHPKPLLPTSDDSRRHHQPTQDDVAAIYRPTAYLKQEVDIDIRLLEIELLLLAVAIGVQDAISFPDFHCFASNQTGNTVLFAVGLLLNGSVHAPGTGGEKPLFSITTIGVSLGFFVLGCLVTGQTANYFGAVRTRGWLLFSNFISTALVYVAASLQWHFDGIVGGDTTLGRIIIGILAFSSGSQVSMVRGLRITDITTAMATAAYIDIFIDPELFIKLSANRARNRRVLFLFALVIGSFVGAGVGSKLNSGMAILLSAIIKSIVTLLLLFHKSKE